MQEHHFAVSTEKSAIIASQITGAAVGGQENTIESRFGKIAVRRENPVVFSKGLLGFPDRTQFCLLDFPVEKFAQFKLLQSLEEDELSFITLPLALDNPIIERADLVAGCAELGFAPEETAILLIVCVHRELKQVRLSANARAPLFIQAHKRRAEQYVLHNGKYLVRHMLTS